jgi:hypothetical protein
MSDSSAVTPRPVALIATLFIFAIVAIGWFVVSHYYEQAPATAFNSPAENLPKDLEWKATPATRRKALTELREKQGKQATSYAWVDQKTGVVQLPIDRAMELTAERYSSKK